jgi:hypothetical protein
MLMIRPERRSTMCRPKTWHARSVPVRFVSRIADQSPSLISSVGVRFVRPAQLTSTSAFPNAPTVLSRSRWSDARSVTSEVSRSVFRPRDSISLAVASTCSRRRDDATTSAPASASPWARARPIPEVPPRTTAVLPVRSRRE